MTISSFFRLVQTTGNKFMTTYSDPLVIHNSDNKSPELTAALNALKEKNHVFKPVGLTNPELLFGHGQTLLTEIKDDLINLGPFYSQFLYTYTRNEIFTLSDGGKISIDYKFKCDEDMFGNLEKI